MAAKGGQISYIVYLHKNKINNKIYIGQTHKTFKERCGKNGNGYKSSPHFYHAIQKYGWENFQHIIIKTNLNAEQADQLEMQLIKKYEATNPKYGYNIRLGGEHGFSYTQEQRERLSKSLRKNSHLHKNVKKVLCRQTKDVFGTISDAERWANTTHINQVLSGRRKFAGRDPRNGQKLSWEYADENANITKICKEKIVHSFPKLKSNETKVVCINTGEIFFSMKDAANWCHLKDTSNISRCCRNLRQSAGKHPQTNEKLKWRYLNDSEKENLIWGQKAQF